MPGKREEYLTWDEYFMGQALEVSLRSKDPSTQVGACIISSDNKQVSIGYNGLTNGMDDDQFSWNSPGEKTGDLYTTKNPWVAHAELNAILNCHGANLEGTTIYVTLFPCNECAKAIIQAGIKKVVYLRMYNDEMKVKITKEMFDKAGVEYIPYNPYKNFSKEEVQGAANEIQKILKRFSVKSDIVNSEYNDQYFMSLAEEISTNSDCRRHVGAVIARDNKVLVTGYNAAPVGCESCIELGGCMRQEDNIPSGTRQEYCRAVHAEQNAIIQAATEGISIKGGTLYVTTYPCNICARMIMNCKLKRIVYQGDYQDEGSHNMLKESGIIVEKYEPKVKKIGSI